MDLITNPSLNFNQYMLVIEVQWANSSCSEHIYVLCIYRKLCMNKFPDPFNKHRKQNPIDLNCVINLCSTINFMSSTASVLTLCNMDIRRRPFISVALIVCNMFIDAMGYLFLTYAISHFHQNEIRFSLPQVVCYRLLSMISTAVHR